MTTCAVMMVKDEADVIVDTLQHLAYHVDETLVLDNGSTDGTVEIIEELSHSFPIVLRLDAELAYMQADRTTALALEARERGHAWAVPCDADEIWHPSHEPDRRIADYLDGLAPDVLICEGALFDHFPTGDDRLDGPVFERLGYRNVQPGGLPKVAVRLKGDVQIHMGNHGAVHVGKQRQPRAGGLTVRHFSWRSEKQYVRKIVNGRAAYAAAGDRLNEDWGVHWRMFEGATDEAIAEHYWTWFYKADPAKSDPPLVFDPAPLK